MSLIKKFNEIEKDYFDYKIRGVQVWSLVREKVYTEVNSYLKKTTKSNKSDKEKPFYIKIKSFLSICKNTIGYFFHPQKKIKYLFLCHPRKKMDNGLYKDIYTDPIIDRLDSDYLVLEGLFQMKHLTPSYQKEVLFIDIFDFWPRLISLVWTPSLNENELKPWRELEVKFLEEFNFKVDLINEIKKEYLRARISVWGLKKILKKLQPRLIIEVVGYSRLCKQINMAAKELKIPTLELQHGFINESHPAYNYPKVNSLVETFPDYIGVWSGYYENKMTPPILKENIISCGFKYFEDQISRQKSKGGSSILFISQGPVGDKLGGLAMNLAELLSSKIVYKLHPKEVQDAKSRYKDLYKAENVLVDADITSDLYQRIFEAEVVIGVYSTALIEAASLGKKVIVVGLPGWEYFKELVEEKSFPMYYSNAEPQELRDLILNLENKYDFQAQKLIERYDHSFLNLGV